MPPRAHLSDLVTDFARNRDQIAVVAQRGIRHRRTTYIDLAILSRRFAAELSFRQITRGDRVLIWAENSAEWIAAFFGCVLRGVLPVPLDASSEPVFVEKIIDEVSPKLIVADTGMLLRLRTQIPTVACDSLSAVVTASVGCRDADLSENDPLQIVFTSGTTGAPKGVVHTHANVLASLGPIETEIHRYIRYERIFHPLRFLHTLPLSHVFGQFLGLWIPALLAAEVHFATRLIPGEMIQRVKRERISVIAAVPRILDLLKSSVEQRHPGLKKRIVAASSESAWKRWWTFRDVHASFGLKFWAFVSGGASLAPVSEEFWNALGFLVIQGYGMTETTALISLNHPFRPARGTVGQVLPGRQVRIGDDGEVQVKGDTVASSFWQKGAVHEQRDPWLATGDLAEFDGAGNLRFRGRKKDVIVTSAGLNIYPDDVESALRLSPGVLDCVVVGQEGQNGPEAVAIMIVADANAASGAVVLANEKLAEYQRIRRWSIWPEADFPRTANGKVLRRELARGLEEQAESGAHRISATELALDSLGRVELQAEIEKRFGVTLPDEVISTVKTDEQLRIAVVAHSRDSLPLHSSEPVQSPARRSQPNHLYPVWPWSAVCQVLRTLFLECVAMPLVRALAKPKVTRLCPSSSAKCFGKQAPLLLVANHVTAYDVPLILYSLPRPIRTRVAVAMAGEMVLDWRLGRGQKHWFLNLVAPLQYFLVTGLFNVFPLPQAGGFRESFTHIGEAADRSYHVLVFPEGRRSETEAFGVFKLGAGLLWRELGTDVLPIRLRGLGELKANGKRRWFRSGAISVTVGSPMRLDPTMSVEESVAILRKRIETL